MTNKNVGKGRRAAGTLALVGQVDAARQSSGSNAGRKSRLRAEPVDVVVNEGALAEATKAANTGRLLATAVGRASGFFMNVGRIQAAQFMETVSAKVIAKSYAELRSCFNEINDLGFVMPDGEVKQFPGIDEACQYFLGIGERRCRQLAASIALLGEELYDSAERLGLRARDYQAIKGLPGPELEAVKASLDAGDKSAVLDIISEYAARDAAQKAKLEEAEKDKAAKDKVIAAKDAKLSEQQEQLARRQSIEPSEAEKDQVKALDAVGAEAEMVLRKLIGVAKQVLAAPATESATLAARHACERVAQVHAQLLDEAEIPVQFEELVTPGWVTKAQAEWKARQGA